MSSRMGESSLHGGHHSAEKSTRIGSVEDWISSTTVAAFIVVRAMLRPYGPYHGPESRPADEDASALYNVERAVALDGAASVRRHGVEHLAPRLGAGHQ